MAADMPPRYKQPSTPAERQRREQADADKLAALHTRLAEQVAALRTGADWRAWLDVAHRFHTYSFHNTLLIGAQRPEATTVAGYRAWQVLGRQVDKGEHGIGILAPLLRRPRADDRGSGEPTGPDDPAKPSGAGAGEADDRPGRLAGFRVAYVWDVAQTSGRPLPEQPRPQLLTGDAPLGLWESLTGLVAGRGFTVERGDCGPANGITDFTRRTVRVRGDVDDAQAVKTLAHEAGHVLLHDPADRGGPAVTSAGFCRGSVEVEAESLAYLVAATHGLATDDYTFPYVTGWAASITGTPPEQAIRDTAGRVLSAARTVLAVTAPESIATVDGTLAARVHAGAERTAAALAHAETAPARSATQPRPAAPAAAVDVGVLVRLHADAAAFYTTQLTADTPHAARARNILTERAVPAAAVAAYQVGYAPPGWTALTDHLHGLGYTDPQLLAAGVGLAGRRGTVLDRFRDRIMFPVHDPAGQQIVAFLGRALDPAGDTPKYLNSPQTALYCKGEVLYGLGAQPGRHALAAGARPVIVEGALDAIAVTTAGHGRHVGVAPSGTALTAGQITALDRAAGPLASVGVVVAFDSDPAGRQAALRAYPLLRAAGAWPTTTDLPDGHDPASLTQHHGTAALTAALQTARPLAELVIDEQMARWAGRLDWPEGRIGAARDAAQIIAALPPEHVGPQVARLADRLGLDPATITAAVLDAFTGPDSDPRPDADQRSPSIRRYGPDPDQPVNVPPSPARLAGVGYPRGVTASATAPATTQARLAEAPRRPAHARPSTTWPAAASAARLPR